MLTVYGDIKSGNCYKIKLLLALLEVPHAWQHMNLLQGDTKQPAFLAKSPSGQVPIIELDDGRVLAESNAILHYLAEGSEFLPTDRFLHAKVLQWQFFEQYSHEPYIAVARYIAKYLGLPEQRRQEYESLQAGGNKALAVLEQQLRSTPYLAGNEYTIADISLYGYTHCAHEGGFDLAAYPHLQAWLARVASHPRHVTMQQFLA